VVNASCFNSKLPSHSFAWLATSLRAVFNSFTASSILAERRTRSESNMALSVSSSFPFIVAIMLDCSSMRSR
jgi:hypothetical protein